MLSSVKGVCPSIGVWTPDGNAIRNSTAQNPFPNAICDAVKNLEKSQSGLISTYFKQTP